jgi:hypothetical protein
LRKISYVYVRIIDTFCSCPALFICNQFKDDFWFVCSSYDLEVIYIGYYFIEIKLDIRRFKVITAWILRQHSFEKYTVLFYVNLLTFRRKVCRCLQGKMAVFRIKIYLPSIDSYDWAKDIRHVVLQIPYIIPIKMYP